MRELFRTPLEGKVLGAGDLMKKALIARAFVAGSEVEPESALGGHES
jgi:hypothetical protein